ncbi:MAG: DUF4446 family protein [Candidatus Saccharibacteria bacterium]
MNVIVLIVLGIVIAICGWLFWRLQRVERQFGAFFDSTQPQPVMRALNQFASTIQNHDAKLHELKHNLDLTTRLAEHAGTRIGFVRFNPFNDTGGDQSFCLAIIDARGDGYILSSIHARTGTRVYSKQIHHGKSSHNLSDEEAAALTKAVKQNPRSAHAE